MEILHRGKAKKQLSASWAMVWSRAAANAVNNVMIEGTTAACCYSGLHPPSSLPSQASKAHPATETGTLHEEMELEIVIIDKHFSNDLVCPATRKLQGCCSKLSTEATDFICLRGARMQSHKLRSINDAESRVGN